MKGDKKNPAAVALGKRRAAQLSGEDRAELGRRGGEARAANLSKKQRSESARKAARARWAKKQ